MLQIDQEEAKKHAIAFLTHGILKVSRCSAVRKGSTWYVLITLEKPKATKLVKVDGENGHVSVSSFQEIGNLYKLKIVMVAFVFCDQLIKTFSDDTPIQSVVNVMNTITLS